MIAPQSRSRSVEQLGPHPRRQLVSDLTAVHVCDLKGLGKLDPGETRQVELEPTGERVDLVAVPQHVGGVRWYYRCSCDRRAAILYLNEGRYRCRVCHHLAYASQNRPKRTPPEAEEHRQPVLPERR